MMDRQLILLGGGGHAKVVAEAAVAAGWSVKGVIDPKKPSWEIPYLGDDGAMESFRSPDVRFIVAIGDPPSLRQVVYERVPQEEAAIIIHPGAIISVSARIAPGCQIMAGAVLQADVTVAENSIINTGARIDHDCQIGPHSHVAPGAVLCGGIIVGSHALIGAGAVLTPGVRIGEGAVVAAGAVVVRDTPANGRVGGVPAQPL